MGKKNTLLYLDEELVDRAKRMDINMSKLAEEALKERIYPVISAGSKPIVDLDRVLGEMEERGSCHRLPFRVDTVSLTNIGPIKEVELSFEKMNVIVSPNAHGKTTLLEAIAHAQHRWDRSAGSFLQHDAINGEIQVDIADPEPLRVQFERRRDSVSGSFDAHCLLIDGLLGRMDDIHNEKLLAKLVERDEQIIATEYDKERYVDREEVNLIDLGEVAQTIH